MADRLEDILGGVEEEIRRAEERLQLDVFRAESPAGATSPDTSKGTRTGPHVQDVAESSDLRAPLFGASASNSLYDAALSTPNSTRSARRRAWVDLMNDGHTSISSGGSSGDRYGSMHGREAVVNRLLRERDARLCLPAGTSGATGEESDGRHGRTITDVPSSNGAMTVGGQTTRPKRDHHRRDNRDAAGGSSASDGGGSPSSNRDNIFFASDLVGISNGATDPQSRAPEETLDLLRLRALAASGTFPARSKNSTPEEHVAGEYTPQELGDVCAAAPPLPPPGKRLSQRPRTGRPTGGGARDCAPAKPREENYRIGEKDEPRRQGGDMATSRLEDQLSFRPKINKRSSLQHSGQKQRASGESRIEELARNRQGVYSDRERQRREMQEEAETKECTFHPKLVAASASGVAERDVYGGDGGGNRLPLHERLHKEAREREAARALAQHHLEKESLRECTFQPTLTAGDSTSFDQRPLHQRVWEVEREREHRLRLLHADKEKREGATFAPPPMGRVSERLARDARPAAGVAAAGTWGGDGVTARFEGQATCAKERRRQMLQEYEEAEARTSTFEPVISRGTETLVRKRPELQVPFEERQAMLDAKKRERERVRLAARAEEEMRWFNPTTARRTDTLLRRRMPQRLQETTEERVTRMAGAEDQRRRAYVDLQRAKEKRECTFRPSLNPVTQLVGKSAPLDELVNNRRGQRVRERAQAKARDAQACLHKPVLLAEAALLQAHPEAIPGPSSRSSHGARDGGKSEIHPRNGDGRRQREGAGHAAGILYGPGNKYRLHVREPGRMTAELRAREQEQGERVRALRQEQEVAEMQRCTFVPRTNTGILSAHGPVVVRGLGRHLELKDFAQQREEERREREAHAFGVRPGAVRRTVLGETVLEPFSLSVGDSKGWWEARRRKHEDERAAQCTFKPWTVEGERNKALSRLMEWSSALFSSGGGGSSVSIGGSGGSIGGGRSEAPLV